MTPGIKQAKKAKIDHTIYEYEHQDSVSSYGLEAAQMLDVAPERVFKTLVAQLDGKQLVVGLVPVCCSLNMKRLAKAAKAKKATMAEPSEVERVTGYVLGGVSPLGQKKRLPTFIDLSATLHQSIYVSAGRRGLEIELNPEDLARLVQARFTELVSSSE